MVSNSDVAYSFANNSERGNSGNMFIEGRAVYSYGYHFPIAFKLGFPFNTDGRIALFNNRGYSNTTSKHKSYVRSALISKGYTLIEVELNSDSDLSEDRIKEVLKKQYSENQKQIIKLISEQPRKRTERTQQLLREQIKELENQNRLMEDSVIIDEIGKTMLIEA